MATATPNNINQTMRDLSLEGIKVERPKQMKGIRSVILDACDPKFMNQARKFNYKFMDLIKQDEQYTCITYESELQPLLQKNIYCKILRKIRSKSILFDTKHVSDLTQRLKFTCLTSLQLDLINFLQNTVLDQRSFEINYLRQLTNLTLSFDEYYRFNRAGLLSLSKNLRYLATLKNLTLSFYFRNEQVKDDQALAILCKGLKHLNSLSTLFLFFGKNTEISDEGLRNLSNTIQGLPSLSDLTLRLSHKRGFTDVGVEHLFEGFVSLQSVKLEFFYRKSAMDFISPGLQNVFKKLRSLKTLDLDFQGYELHDQDIERIFEAIQYLASLSELLLDFSYSHKYQNLIIQKPQTIEGLQKITKFDINFRGSSVQYNGVNSIFEWVQNLKSLETFDFKLSGYKISDHSCVIKPKEFQQFQLNSLTMLKFIFQDSEVEYHKLLQKLLFALGSLKNLQILHVDVANCKCFGADAAEGLGDLLAGLPKLSELHLNLTQLSKLDSRGSHRIFKAFENLEYLSSLEIALCRSKYSGLNELKNQMKFLSNLKKLDLNMSGCEVVTKDATDLCQSLALLTSLSSLHLNFEYIDLNDSFFESLSESLKTFNHPKPFEFYLHLKQYSSGRNPGIPIKGFMFLMQGLSYIPNLSKLGIDFGSNTNIDNSCLQACANIFKKLTTLTELWLNFEACREIEDNELLSFVESILQVKTLTCLQLEFPNCNINETTMIHLVPRVRKIGSGSLLRW